MQMLKSLVGIVVATGLYCGEIPAAPVSADIGGVQISIPEPRELVAHGAGTKVSITTRQGVAEEMPIVMVLAFIHVKSRLFAVVVYRKLTWREDIDAAKARALAWTETITKANP